MYYEDPLYGSVELPAAVTDLLHTGPIQRLCSIHQGEAVVLANPVINHTHFDYSMGVLLLIWHLGGSLREQLAACCTTNCCANSFSHILKQGS
jgi:HD superfamily phosphohydrolase